ncbi:hypothetical protein ACQUQP_10500 [Marinobacterium sp. YM272]|uniref:hypothetical protein n=1 Tax=Marinobacterium sp. YM272 TaxID=3421654 RepID=UPI003D7F82C3
MNTIPSAFSSGLDALRTASGQVEQSAQTVAQQPARADDSTAASLEQALVDQTQAETYALAGVKVVQTADAVIGTLLDLSV